MCTLRMGICPSAIVVGTRAQGGARSVEVRRRWVLGVSGVQQQHGALGTVRMTGAAYKGKGEGGMRA